MNNALTYFGGFLVVVFAALFAVPAMIDWNGYRGIFEEEASKVLGRDVRVNGGVNLRLLPTPYVRFEKVRLADTSGKTGEPFIRAESFTMWLAVSPLLRGLLEANKIELDKPQLTLALDDNGSGNWADIALKPGSMPFVPRDVALRSVQLKDGTISVFNATALQIARVTGINGELSADALKGPFRFKGQATWDSADHDVRFATTEPDPSGAYRLKASAQTAGSKTQLNLDGKLENIATKPTFSGALTGKVALPKTAEPGPIDQQASQAAKAVEPLLLDLKATIAADTIGAKLNDLTMSVESSAEPQLITGSGETRWAGNAPTNVALQSKWLDLDRLAAQDAEQPQVGASLPDVRKFGLGLLETIAGNGSATAKIEIDQVKLGGEPSGGLRIDVSRDAGQVIINELAAGLPGGSRLTLTGKIAETDGARDFDGDIFVHGTSLSRLKTWAERSGSVIDIAADGRFSVEGRLKINQQRFELSEASADIGGRKLTGELRVIDENGPRADITIESPSIDTSELFPSTVKMLDQSLKQIVSPEPRAASETPLSDTKASQKTEKPNIAVRVLAGELKHAGKIYRDVDATVDVQTSLVRIPAARFTTAGGLVVRVNGDMSNETSDAPARGNIAFDLSGATPAAVTEIVQLFALSNVLTTDRVANIGSANLAGLLRLGGASKIAADKQTGPNKEPPSLAQLSLDGMVGAAHVTMQAEFENGLAEWRTAPSNVHVSATAEDISGLTRMLGAKVSTPAGDAQPRAARATLALAGPLAKNADVVWSVNANGLDLRYDGHATLDAADVPRVATDGRLTVVANDLRDAAAFMFQPLPHGVAATPVAGVIDIARSETTTTLTSKKLQIGGANVIGAIDLSAGSTSATTKVAGNLTVSQLSVIGVLSALTVSPIPAQPALSASPPRPDLPNQTAGEAQPTSIWPSAAFDFAALTNLEGEIKIAFDRLSLASDAALNAKSGKFTLAFAPSSASVKSFEAQAAGGTLTGDVSLSKESDGTAASIRLKLANGELSTFSPQAAGRATLDVMATSRGPSPAMLLALLQGKGTLALEDARVPGPSVDAVRNIADQVMTGQLDTDSEAFGAVMWRAISEANIELGLRTIPVTVSGGTLRIDPIVSEGSSGQAIADTAVNLSTLQMTSAWKVAPSLSAAPALVAADVPEGWEPQAAKGPLMAMPITYAGRIDRLAERQITYDTAPVERDLLLRLTERNVSELERLRKLDEQRGREDAERRKAFEAQRALEREQRALKQKADREARNKLRQGPPPGVEQPDDDASNGVSATPTDPNAPPTPSPVPQPAAQGPAPPISTTGAVATPDASTANTAPTDQAAQSAPVTPSAAPEAERPRPAQQKRRPAERRTTSDEIMRSLGGIP